MNPLKNAFEWMLAAGLRSRMQIILMRPTLNSTGSRVVAAGILITTLLGITLRTKADTPAVAAGEAQAVEGAHPKPQPNVPEPPLFVAGKDGKDGFINPQGELVIDSADEFRNGIARVGSQTLKNHFLSRIADVGEEYHYKFIDKTGEFVIQPRFEHASNFSEGLAGVPLGPEGWGVIDKTGKTVIEPRFAWIYDGFRHGIVGVAFDGKAGYIDKQGDWVWPPSD